MPRNRRCDISKPLAAAVLASWLALGAWAEDKVEKPPKAPPPSHPAAAAHANAGPGAGAGHRLNNPLNPGQRFLQMTPEEQERLMERANPQQRQRMQEALARYNSLPPAARERLLRQYQLLKDLPAGQQALISRQFRAFNQLPDDRRWPVGQELVRLHRMEPYRRAASLDSPDFAAHYSPPEQQILRDLSTNLPAEYPLGGK